MSLISHDNGYNPRRWEILRVVLRGFVSFLFEGFSHTEKSKHCVTAERCSAEQRCGLNAARGPLKIPPWRRYALPHSETSIDHMLQELFAAIRCRSPCFPSQNPLLISPALKSYAYTTDHTHRHCQTNAHGTDTLPSTLRGRVRRFPSQKSRSARINGAKVERVGTQSSTEPPRKTHRGLLMIQFAP